MLYLLPVKISVLQTAQRGLHQPGFTHMTLSSEECRILNMHRNLERHGPGWEGVRDGVAEEGGWPLYLARYADVVASGG